MPGVCRYGVNKIIPFLEPLVKKGLSSILIFGVISSLPKDETGSSADASENPVVQILPKLRAKFPKLLLACDVSISSQLITRH